MQYRQRIAVLGPQEKRSQPREAKRRYWSWLSSLVNFLSNRFTNHATDSRTHPCARQIGPLASPLAQPPATPPPVDPMNFPPSVNLTFSQTAPESPLHTC